MALPAFALLLALQPAPTAPAERIEVSRQNPSELFSKAKCVLCHGEDGRARTKKGKQLRAEDFTAQKWNEHTTDKEIKEAISDGIKDKKGRVRMPAFKTKLTPEQIDALAAYVRTFAKNPPR